MGKQNSLTKSDDGEELDINPTFSRRVMMGRKESHINPVFISCRESKVQIKQYHNKEF